VIAPARTGKDKSNRIAVKSTDQTNNGVASNPMDEDRMFIIVVIKLMAPKIEETPAKCNLKMAKSMEVPE